MERRQERAGDESDDIVSRRGTLLADMGGHAGDVIDWRRGSDWIAVRSRRAGRVFAEVRPHRHRIEVFILPRAKDLRDPRGLARKAPPTQGWGWFRSRFDILGERDLGPAVRLIRQSYALALHAGNGRNRRRPRRTQSV